MPTDAVPQAEPVLADLADQFAWSQAVARRIPERGPRRTRGESHNSGAGQSCRTSSSSCRHKRLRCNGEGVVY